MFKTGDWVATVWRDSRLGENPRIARVQRVHEDGAADLVLYFEPCCELGNWVVIEKPVFPLPRYGYSNYLGVKHA